MLCAAASVLLHSNRSVKLRAGSARQLPNAQLPVVLPPPPDLQGADPRRSYNAASLAFLGDSVWEVYIRKAFLNPWARSNPISPQAQQLVNTHAQAACYGLLQSLAEPSESALQAPSSGANTARTLAGSAPVVPEECTANSSSSSTNTSTGTSSSSSSSSVQAVSAGEGLAPSPALLLTATEADVLRWAANSTTNSPPSHATRQQYKQATAVEALVGYWYLTDLQRLHQVLTWLLQPQQLQQWAPPLPAPRQPAGKHKQQKQAAQQRQQGGPAHKGAAGAGRQTAGAVEAVEQPAEGAGGAGHTNTAKQQRPRAAPRRNRQAQAPSAAATDAQ